ncbi:short-chain dehydrogenase [Pseudomonas sp. 910_21]
MLWLWLHANGAARLPAVTPLESLSRAELKSADDTDLQHISNAAAILLRDSCDLLGVMGWQPAPSALKLA